MRKAGKVLRWVLVIAFGLFVVAQFVRPARTNPAADQSLALETQMQVDPKVSAILDRSCVDCHSNKTQWPWYTNVAPVSWFVIDHVNEGRRHLNLSEWGKYNARRRADKLSEMCEMVKEGEMPLSSYTPLHPGSKLTADDVQTICNWTNAERAQLAAR